MPRNRQPTYNAPSARKQANRAPPWCYPHPLWASHSVLSYVLDNGWSLCAAPFHPVQLVCPNCPEPHDVGIAYVRIDRPEVPLWLLYVSGSAGAA